jgi:hypothetical protein
VDDMPNNGEYNDFLIIKAAKYQEKLKERYQDKLKRIEKEIESNKIELKAFMWLIKNNVPEKYIENCIYYSHTGKFCFGWRNKLTDKEKRELEGFLCEFLFDYDFK